MLLSGFDNPVGIDRDGSDLIVAENGLDRVLRVALDGSGSFVVFQSGVTAPMGLASEAAGQMGIFRYINHGNFTLRVSSDGTTTDIDLADGTRGVALDQSGIAYISTESGGVSKILFGTSTVVPFASGFTQPTGMDFRPAKFGGDQDRVGFLYVADPATGQITQINNNGVASVFVAAAGAPNYLVFEVGGPTPTPTPTPSPTPTPTPSPSPTATPIIKAQNISSRVNVETGDNVAIGGFIINGGRTAKNVVIRAIGPSLANATPPVAGSLSDPILELHKPNGTVLTNNDWMTNSVTNQAIIAARGFDMYNGSPISDVESILVVTLSPRDLAVPGSGEYTAVVRGKNGATGVGLVEIYDLDDPSASAELANISTRGITSTSDNVLIGGVIIGPSTGDTLANATVVLRAIGPSLADATPPVLDALPDPVLELHNGDGDLIALNDNWKDGDQADQIEKALGLAPTKPKEAALLANLVAGNYTAIVMGSNGGTGVALVEVFHVPTPTVQ